MKKMCAAFCGVFVLGGLVRPLFVRADTPRRYEAREIRMDASGAGLRYFFRPVALIFRAPNLWVLDSDDNGVRVFSGAGDFLHAFGRKGNGPGEFDMPTDMDILGERVYIADGANRRVQILDRKGTYLGGFRVPFFPWRITVLDEDRVVVALLPSGRKGKEKTLHCFSGSGKLLWEARDSHFSGDSAFDALRNDIFLRRGEEGYFYVIGRAEERLIMKMNREGIEVGKINVSDAYPMKTVAIPAAGGGRRELSAFCWNADWHGGKFYLLIPEHADRKDVEPGKQAAVVDGEGRVEAFMDFPVPVSRLAVAGGGKIFGLDSEGELRIFEVVAR